MIYNGLSGIVLMGFGMFGFIVGSNDSDYILIFISALFIFVGGAFLGAVLFELFVRLLGGEKKKLEESTVKEDKK